MNDQAKRKWYVVQVSIVLIWVISGVIWNIWAFPYLFIGVLVLHIGEIFFISYKIAHPKGYSW